VLNFGFTLFLVRYLDVTSFGTFSFAASMTLLGTAIADFGLTVLTIKSVAQAPGSLTTYAKRVVRLKLLMAITLFALCLPPLLLHKQAPTLPFLLVGLACASVLSCYTVVVSACLSGMRRMWEEGFIRIATTVFTLVFSSIGLLLSRDLAALGIGALVGSLATCLATLAIYRPWPRIPQEYRLISSERKGGLLREALPFGLLAILVTISYRIDMILLEYFKGPAEVAIYASAYRVFDTAVLVRGVLGAVLLPVFSHAFARGDSDLLRRSTTLAIKYHTIVGVTITLTLSMVAPEIITTLYSKEAYTAAILPLRILALASIPVWISAITSVLISASPYPAINTQIALLMAVLNISLNLVAIPRWGAVGAAAITVMTECVGVVTNTIYLYKYLFLPSYGLTLLFGLVIIAAALIAYAWQPSVWLYPLALLLLTTALFSSKTMTFGEVANLLGHLRQFSSVHD
jgi:O-antigen/teichoic acid export membrane protein